MGDNGSVDYRRTLATSYTEQGDAELDLNNFSVAAELYKKAAEMLDQNSRIEQNEDRDYDRALLAATLALHADATQKNGDIRGAAGHLAQAKRIQEELARDQPGNTLYQMYLGRIYASLAALQAEEQQPTEAVRLYAMAIEIGEALHQGDRTQKEYGLLLCRSLRGAEAVAKAQGESQRTELMKARRCDVARHFTAQDGEDRRFKPFVCL
jgi:tetratricopeptide (TPR) repeat protein